MIKVSITESDPTGRRSTDPGAKLDAGKLRPATVFQMFSRALREVAKVGTYGIEKYSVGGWQEVPEGRTRYADAEMRHLLSIWGGEEHDKESGLLHEAHKAWNTLAQLELRLREDERSTD